MDTSFPNAFRPVSKAVNQTIGSILFRIYLILDCFFRNGFMLCHRHGNALQTWSNDVVSTDSPYQTTWSLYQVI